MKTLSEYKRRICSRPGTIFLITDTLLTAEKLIYVISFEVWLSERFNSSWTVININRNKLIELEIIQCLAFVSRICIKLPRLYTY